MLGDNSFFTIFQAFIGAYLLYCGITGKGQAYKAENIKKEMRAQFNKFMRIFCLVMGPIALLSALFEHLSATNSAYNVGVYITYGLFGAGVVYALVMTMRMTDRPQKKKKTK